MNTAEEVKIQYEYERDRAMSELNKKNQEIVNLKSQIEKLNEEKEQLKETIKEKDSDLYKYKFKIKDLQKSKHVLTHRAKGIHASLEPKEK